MSDQNELLKSLEELEGQVWGEPAYDSHLVTTVHRLRNKPIGEFTIEDLRIVIGQGIGLRFLMPLAIGQLERNPLAEGDFYPGDLLRAVASVAKGYWQEFPAMYKRACDVFRLASRQRRESLPAECREPVDDVLRQAARVFHNV